MDSRLNPPCTHSKTSADAFLDVVSFSIVVVENYGPPSDERGDQIAYPRLLKQISVVAEESESGRDILLKFWRELQGLRKLISKKWAGNFADLKDISISKTQQDELDKAAFCYACQKPFDPTISQHLNPFITIVILPSTIIFHHHNHILLFTFPLGQCHEGILHICHTLQNFGE